MQQRPYVAAKLKIFTIFTGKVSWPHLDQTHQGKECLPKQSIISLNTSSSNFLDASNKKLNFLLVYDWLTPSTHFWR